MKIIAIFISILITILPVSLYMCSIYMVFPNSPATNPTTENIGCFISVLIGVYLLFQFMYYGQLFYNWYISKLK